MGRATGMQRRVLNRLADGETIVTLRHSFESDAERAAAYTSTSEPVNLNTFHALRARGWIESIDADWRGGRYALTPAGRAAQGGTDADD